jgi:hypothetical protein
MKTSHRCLINVVSQISKNDDYVKGSSFMSIKLTKGGKILKIIITKYSFKNIEYMNFFLAGSELSMVKYCLISSYLPICRKRF